MKVYIIPDLEGVAGVTQFRQNLKSMGIYENMCKRMVNEINVVIEGIKEGEETAEIYVMETHEIDDEIISPKITGLIRGARIPLFDSSYDALFFVGQHSKSQTENGVLCHTGNARIMKVKINEIEYGELGIGSIFAGTFDISTIFVSGDSECVKEAKKLFKRVITVESKIGIGMHSAICFHPKNVLKELKEKAKEAIIEYKKNPESFPPLKIPSPYELEIEWQYIEMADRASLIPGVKKISKRITYFKSENFEDIYKCLAVQAQIALAGYI
ncbi:MAG: M55 family metallopeptidase [Candidatus Omnitrophica bacterium]|nr:M55 family metallopeptidase [Candidatus Omnitrophota bacterium]